MNFEIQRAINISYQVEIIVFYRSSRIMTNAVIHISYIKSGTG